MGFSAGNNRVASRQHKFCKCLIGYLPCGEKLGCSAGNNGVYICVFEKEINIKKNIFYFVRSFLYGY